MNFPKLIAIGVTVGVLGAQFLIQSVATIRPIGDWYWPFMGYGMYSFAHYATDSVPDYRLRARPCDSAATAHADAVSLGSRDIGMTPFRLREVLQSTVERATMTPVDTAAIGERTRFVDALVRHTPGNWCEAEIWERKYANTGDVAAALQSPWHLAIRWPIGRGGGSQGWTRGDRIAPPVAPIASLPELTAAASTARAQR